jgi:hypothetical protein
VNRRAFNKPNCDDGSWADHFLHPNKSIFFGVAQSTSRMHDCQPSDIYETGSKVDEPIGSST